MLDIICSDCGDNEWKSMNNNGLLVLICNSCGFMVHLQHKLRGCNDLKIWFKEAGKYQLIRDGGEWDIFYDIEAHEEVEFRRVE